MSKMDRDHLHRRRLLMGNPYAHIEQLHELESGNLGDAAKIRASRISLQNPYAYLDENGGFSASHKSAQHSTNVRTFEEIEQLARAMQRMIWKERFNLWRDGTPTSPVLLLDPSKACSLLGFDFELVDSLGMYSERVEKIAVAGLIDQSAKTIKVSRDFLPPVRNFTAAHELGHALMHSHMDRVHRDRAIDGARVARDRVELEADKFATYFLLPKKLVVEMFVERFLTNRFALSDDTVFALLNKSIAAVSKRFLTRRQLSRELASAVQYNGRNFYSLAQFFNVTVETMAIRLEELDLVDHV